MKHAYTQAELATAHARRETIMIGYRSSATIRFSRGLERWIAVPMTAKAHGMPYTAKGRRHLITEAHFMKIQQVVTIANA